MPRSFRRWGIARAGSQTGRGRTLFFGYGTGDGSCKEHPAVGFGAKLGPVLLLKNTAAINNSVCFLQCLQIRRVNTSHRAFAFFSWPPPFSRDATEPGEGPCYSIALHFLSQEESQVTPLLKNHAGWPVLRPPQGLGGLLFCFFLFSSFFFSVGKAADRKMTVNLTR